MTEKVLVGRGTPRPTGVGHPEGGKFAAGVLGSRGVARQRRTVVPRRAPFGFVGPALALLAVLYGVPIVLDGYYSLTNDQLGGSGKFVGTANFVAVAGDGLFWHSVENNIIFTVLTVGGGTLLALGVALLLSGSFVGKGIYRFIIYLPQSVSFASGAVIWTWLYNTQSGPVDAALSRLGLPAPNWLTDPHLALFSIVIMSWWRDIGFYMVVLIAAIENVPQLLVEAARVDGARRVGVFWHVTLPSIRPAMLFVMLTWSLGALQMFTQSFIMTNGGPVDSTYTIVLKIYNDAFQALNLGLGAAEAFVLLAVCIVVGIFAVRWFNRGLQEA